jgi:hypothetical protein
MPGPRRGRGSDAVEANAACVSCHVSEARQWQGSHHQRSNSNPAYRKALPGELQTFCRGCHAPEANPYQAVDAAVGELGVGCVTCHVTEDNVVLAATSATSSADVPHALRRSEAFSTSGACVGCHEFRFPRADGDDDGAFMQTTIREHRDSAAASASCASCHMLLVDGRRSHTFANVRDPAWLRSHLDVSAAQTGDRAITVTLRQPNAGHAFPTGDLFRRLEIGAELLTAEGEVLARAVTYLARHFEVQVGRPGRQLVLDNRVFDQPRIVTLTMPNSERTPAPLRMRWWVTYQRVATAGAGHDTDAATVESSVELHSGVFPWKPES